MQAARREREAEELDELFQIARQHPDEIENIQPNQFGFVCSNRDWTLHFKRRVLLASCQKGIEPYNVPPFNTRDLLSRAA